MRRSLSPGGGPFSPDERDHRSEMSLAIARLWLATAILIAGFLDLDGPASAALVRTMAAGYLLFAAVVLLVLRGTSAHGRVLAALVHGVDLSTAAGMMIVTDAGSTFSVIVAFALIAAAYRWGFRETILTAGAIVVLLLAQAVGVPVIARTADGLPPAVVGNRLVLRSTFFLIAGVLMGYLAHTEKQFRAEATVIANITSRIDVRLGLTQTIAIVLDALVRLFEAKRAVLVVYDIDTERLSRWDGGTPTGTIGAAPVKFTRLDPAEKDTYLVGPTGAGWHAARRSVSRERLDLLWVDREGTRSRTAPDVLPERLLAAVGPFQQMIGLSVDFPGEWAGCLFLIDPHGSGERANAVAITLRIIRRIAPSVYNVYLLRRVRARSVADERARMGRELHDGIVQSILGVQVQLHALAVQASGVRRELAGDLNRLGMTLREEVLRLRDMMQQMKPISPNPDQLVDTIADLAHRFETETGIRTRFITRADRVPLPPRYCLELTRVVQEALVNVRRHSGARNVFVRFAVDGGICRLSVDDDGRGFPFTGRLSLADLDRTHQGSWVIKDRVRRLGGDVTVESVPGRGSRVEISVPVATYAVQG